MVVMHHLTSPKLNFLPPVFYQQEVDKPQGKSGKKKQIWEAYGPFAWTFDLDLDLCDSNHFA